VKLVFNAETLEWDYFADQEYVGPLSSKDAQAFLENLEQYFTDPDWYNK
tara:strand:+ start:86 stop:232 length:147 start_codon:yes stop_codon:yes gene_type:complete